MTRLPPDTPEVHWRRPESDDAGRLYELIRAGELADESPLRTSLEEVSQQMRDPEIELAVDVLLGELGDGRLACFGAVQMRRDVVTRRAVTLFGTVHPDCRRRGLGTSVLRWSEARARERLNELPDDGVPRVLEAWSNERWRDRTALFTSAGFHVIRYFEQMRRPLEQPLPATPLPAGLRFEPWSRQRDEQVRLAHNEAFADHWGSQPWSADTWAHRLTGSPHFRPDLTVCVLDGEDVAGYCMSYHSAEDARATGRREGWLGQIGVRRPWRNRGVASAIICHVMALMDEASLDHAALDVDSDNPTGAAGLYRRLGFVTAERELRWAKDP